MNTMDFIKNYYLHDSLLEGFDVCIDGSAVALSIDLCNWQQDRQQWIYSRCKSEIIVISKE